MTGPRRYDKGGPFQVIQGITLADPEERPLFVAPSTFDVYTMLRYQLGCCKCPQCQADIIATLQRQRTVRPNPYRRQLYDRTGNVVRG